MFQAAFQLGLANVAVIGDFSFNVSSRVDDLVEDVWSVIELGKYLGIYFGDN